MVATWPAVKDVPLTDSVNAKGDAIGDVTPACMSMDTGATARWVMVAAELSTKKTIPEKSPTASATPTTEARVRRGLRSRSRRLKLSNRLFLRQPPILEPD